jgi:predicted PurR-regulated permease PerM
MKELPATVRRSIELLGLCALGAVIAVGGDVIMPLLMAGFMSLLLLPVFRWLRKHRMPEIVAIVICIALLFFLVAGVALFLSMQVAGFLSDIDAIQKNLTVHWNNLSEWISHKTHLTLKQQMNLIQKQGTTLGENVTGYFTNAFSSLTNIFVFLGLLPIYIFLILYYRNLLLRFIYLWFEESEHPKVEEAVRETEVIVKYYLLGLLIQITYLTVLLGGILLLFGIQHAILIGITFAILNLIPYVGALVGNVIGVLLTLTTSQEIWQIWVVLGTIAFVQFLDNNILMPRIVGSKVKVNALVSIVGIVLGGALAGVMGMILSIPVMAVLKIVFDKSSNLKQWGLLLGDYRPELSPAGNRMYRIKHDLEKKHDDNLDGKLSEVKDDDL